MTTKVSYDVIADAVKTAFARKNAIINGDMNVWQRGTSFTSAADGTFSADRWTYVKAGTMVHDLSRSTDVPTVAAAGRLFNYSLLVDCTTADAAIAAGDYCGIIQKIEGYNWLPLAQRVVTLSFWVKATKTGTYCVVLRNSGLDRSYVAEYTISSADTWEKKTVTFLASPSAGTWDYTNGIGAYLAFILVGGSTFQTTAGAWQTGNFFSTANQVNGADNTANDFRITGVQLEPGSVATEFEYRTFQDELALCQRYFEKTYDYGTTPGAGVQTGGTHIVAAAAAGTDHFSDRYKVEKRGTPTVTLYSQDGATGVVNRIGVGNTAATAPGACTTSHRVNFTAVDGNAYMWHWTASAEL